MHYYLYHIGDNLLNTIGLSMLEEGAYRRLIDMYYSKGRLPKDFNAICRLTRATKKAEIDAVRFVLAEFFEETEDGYINTQVDQSLSEAAEKSEKARNAVAARWNKNNNDTSSNTSSNTKRNTTSNTASNTDSNTGSNASSNTIHYPITNNHNINTPHTPQGDSMGTKHPQKGERVEKDETPPQGFTEFWESYPNTNGRRKDKHKCLTLWNKQNLEIIANDIVGHIRAMRNTKKWQNGYEPLCLTYLNGKHWQDGLPDEEFSTWDLKDYTNTETRYYEDGSESF